MSAGRNISRRTVLRGLGAAVSLPMLEAMLPRTARAAGRAGRPPLRMTLLFVPNGMHMPDWIPDKEGDEFDVKPILEPIARFKSQMNVLSGLTLNGGRSLGDGPGDHARCVASYLTGAHPKKTSGKDIKNGASVDQVAADKVGRETRFPSLELGTERSAQAGRCDSGYSCVYTSNMSWRTPNTPMAKEIDPAAVFDRLFGGGDARDNAENRDLRNRYQKSILDFVLEDAKDLHRRLGVSDQRKLDEYLYAVREVERRIGGSDKLDNEEEDVPDYPRPSGVPREFEKHVKLMFDLMTLAFQTNATRISTFMYTNAGSNRNYKQIGVSDGHHSLSHHGNNAEKQAKISKINQYHVSLLGYWLEQLAAVKEGDGTLLDNCMIMYGSGLADGNRHNHHGLPIALIGGGGGTITTGRHLAYPRETPLTNLYLSMLDRMNVDVDTFSDATGRLELA